MQGTNTADNRAHISDDDAVADVRSSGFGITPPDGHGSELCPQGFRPGPLAGAEPTGAPALMPFSTTPEEAVAFIPQLIDRGSDCTEFTVDDGGIEGHPGLPMLGRATLNAGVAEAKRRGILAVAHALTVDATRMTIEVAARS